MSDNTIPESELQKIKSLFKTTDKDLPNKKKITPHRVKVFGSFWVTNSGKTLWASKKNASLAVHNFLYHDLTRCKLDLSLLPKEFLEEFSGWNPRLIYVNRPKLQQFLEENGYIEYIPVPEAQ